MTITYPIIGSLSEENWALIPSDPAVFNDMLNEYGIDEVTTEDLYTLDLDELKKDKTVHGLIFISKYDEDHVQLDSNETDPDADEIIFTSQVVTNVCGTLALLAVLFNADIKNKGPIIENFLNFTEGFTPVNRGLCIGNSTEMRRIHDAYGNTSILADRAYSKNAASLTDSKEVETEDNFHYTAFIYKNGYLWEIDGLKPRPVKIGTCTSENWLKLAEPVLKHRVEVISNKSDDSDMSFSMIAVVEDQLPSLKRRDEILKSNLKKFDNAMASKAKTRAQTVRKNKREFAKTVDPLLPENNRLEHIWNELDQGNYNGIKDDIKETRRYSEGISNNIQTYECNRRIGQENAIRQKFDYFPFINALITFSHKRGLVEDPTPVKAANSRKSKKRKTTPKQPTETENKPVKKRKR